MKIINPNTEICDTLSNDNFRHIYKIYLEKDKKYFVHLQSTNDCEFNLRIYDSNKNIIKFKYDNHDENIFTADIRNDIEYSEIVTSENNDFDYDDENNYNNQTISFKVYPEDEIIEQTLFPTISYTFNNTIHDSLTDAILNYNGSLNNDTIDDNILEDTEDDDNVLINYNNKQYFSPNESNFYLIAVSSDYENYEGEYNLIVKEVEDITISNEEEIQLNMDINILLNNKFDSKKFVINLEKNKFYEIFGSQNITFLISKNEQKIISKVEKNKFKAEYDGLYNIEIISHIDELNEHFSINSINNSNDDDNEFKIINAKKLFLQDENGNKFELIVKDNKLSLKSL